MKKCSWAWVVLCGTLACAPAAATEPPTRTTPSAESPNPAVDEATPASSAASSADDSLSPSIPDTVRAWAPQIHDAAERRDIDPDLVALVVWLESNGQADARSPAGALGLMQMMPATAAAVATRLGQPAPDEASLLDPERNLDLGSAHLAELAATLAVDGLDGDAVHRIAIAYNGGPRVLAAWQSGESLPEETRRYAEAMKKRWEAR